jgi:hypothetical protein
MVAVIVVVAVINESMAAMPDWMAWPRYSKAQLEERCERSTQHD